MLYVALRDFYSPIPSEIPTRSLFSTISIFRKRSLVVSKFFLICNVLNDFMEFDTAIRHRNSALDGNRDHSIGNRRTKSVVFSLSLPFNK